MDGRMQRFDPATEHLRRARQVSHILNRDTGFTNQAGCAAAGNQNEVQDL
jgi:hypothetical protein